MTPSQAIEQLNSLAEQAVNGGDVPALQVAVAHRGRLLWSAAYGSVKTEEGTTSAKTSTVFHAYSAGKPVIAALLSHLLRANGRSWDTPIVALLPYLQGEGMEAVTLAQLARHEAGLPNAPLPLSEAGDPRTRMARMASWAPREMPGTRFVYHPESAWWLLAAAVEALGGLPYTELVQRWLRAGGLLRSGLKPEAEWAADIADVTLCGEHPAQRLADDRSAAYQAAYDAQLLELAQPASRSIGVPGSGFLTTAEDLALLYQCFMRALTHDAANDLAAWMSPSAMCDVVTVDSPLATDPLTGVAAMRGRGVVLAGDAQRYLRGFPPVASAESFGHTGAGGQFAWADPRSELSFALLSSGLERNPFKAGVRGLSLGSAAFDLC